MKSEGIKQDIIQDKTAGELYDFLQAAAWKNIITESLSAHLRAAIKKIFSATTKPNEFWRDAKLPSNIDDLIIILRENNAGSCSEKTIDAYERRYYRSLRLYTDYLWSAQPAASAPPPSTTVSPSAPPSISPAKTAQTPVNSNLQNLVVQKVLAASLKFQQDVLDALSLLAQPEGGVPPSA
ncbi:hypothetical protein IIZ77_00820 [Candidatus Saccharibacteria bacterium]|nr:hypothetical protein [Candidatus Saccharibacteria bacterium]